MGKQATLMLASTGDLEGVCALMLVHPGSRSRVQRPRCAQRRRRHRLLRYTTLTICVVAGSSGRINVAYHPECMPRFIHESWGEMQRFRDGPRDTGLGCGGIANIDNGCCLRWVQRKSRTRSNRAFGVRTEHIFACTEPTIQTCAGYASSCLLPMPRICSVSVSPRIPPEHIPQIRHPERRPADIREVMRPTVRGPDRIGHHQIILARIPPQARIVGLAQLAADRVDFAGQRVTV